MTRTIAFLRAINVGGHTVKMDVLRRHFELLGYTDVETFIASGNVIFTAPSHNAQMLEMTIENKLREALGYEVATFLRTEGKWRGSQITNPSAGQNSKRLLHSMSRS